MVLLAGRRILAGVDLTLRRGAHVALVGPNGSGKSTLLRALKGMEPFEGGSVWVDDVPVAACDPAVGLVFANPEDQGVSPIVEDDVAFGLENLGRPPEEIGRRVEEALRLVGLWEHREAPIHTLSGGQAQLLALGSVLALGARYLLLDEATSMLSPWDREALFVTLEALRRQGVGVLHVTHQPEEVLWAGEVLALETGSIRFRGSPSAFFRWPECPWSAPEYFELSEALSGEGGRCPSYGDLCRWLGRES
ncbi:MAG: ATP-binding cassette domain-containing protein [Deltaproteobacteria bacterium]|nr:ATP-binding cassette domain-containing protein [Deltaproteobacteria bacterium]